MTSSRSISIVVEAVVIVKSSVSKAALFETGPELFDAEKIHCLIRAKNYALPSPKPSPASVEDFPYQATGQTTLVFE